MWHSAHGSGIAARPMAKMRHATCCHLASRRRNAMCSIMVAQMGVSHHGRQHKAAAVKEISAPGHAWPILPMLSMLTTISMCYPGASVADVMQSSSASDIGEQYQLAQAYDKEEDADRQPNLINQPAPAPRPAFCQPDSIARVLSRYQGDIDQGYGGVQNQAELLSFFKQTCTQEELQAGLDKVSYSKADDVEADTRTWLVQEGSSELPEYWRVLLLQAGLAGAAGLAAVAIQCWLERPVGWVASDLVEVQPSPVAGKGLFARIDMPEGTVLGAYPGRVRTPANMQHKLSIAPLSEQYTFITSDRNYLDPTDSTGLPTAWPEPGWPWLFPTPTELAYANEPPPTAVGTNCSVKDGGCKSGAKGYDDKLGVQSNYYSNSPSELLFVTNRDCKAGEEIFIDYGRTYNRSGYGQSS